MLFSEEDLPLLKKWIVKRLENTSDADADVLADYVLALLRHDGDVNAVRALCEAEIPDFLKEDSSIFVRDVFDAIQYRTYAQGAAMPPRSSAPFMPPTGPAFAPPAGPSLNHIGIPGAPTGPQNGSRKRTFNDRGDGDSQAWPQQGGDPNGRAYKQPRRGNMGERGRGGHGNFGNANGGFQNRPPTNFQNAPNMGDIDSLGLGSLPGLDPNNPVATIMALQAMGFPIPPELAQFQYTPAPGRGGPNKQRCRDYDTKGFCARGNSCKFEHGNESIYVPAVKDEYDPNDSGLMTGIESSNGGPGVSNNFRGNDRGRGRGASKRGGQFNGSRRGGRAEFSSDRPNFDRSRTTIVVEQIPEEKFGEDHVRGYFSEFGNILEVTMRPYKRLAIVKFEDYNSAQAAYNSPKVIFDNRFVKVYWFVDPESLPKPPGVHTTNALNAAGALSNGNSNGSPTVSTKETNEPQIDIEEFTRKQQEVQKEYEEKKRKKVEMEAAQKELLKRQEDLLKSQAEEKRKLMERIAAKTGTAAVPDSKAESTKAAPTSGTGEAKEQSQTDMLKAKLAELEAEAMSLGIPTDLSPEDSYGGRGRGRGRGAYRGRGAFVPRGSRGGFRGRGAPYAAPRGGGHSLDNRPKTLGLKGVDFSDAAKEESLRVFLMNNNIEFASLKTSPDNTTMAFKERWLAEKFMNETNAAGGEIPGVGKVEMSWIKTPLPPVNLASKAIKSEVLEEMAMDEGDAMATHSSPAHPVAGQEHQENIDYDVADDNDWGNIQ